MNTFTLGACFQHELHTGPYFMTFAPRLITATINFGVSVRGAGAGAWVGVYFLFFKNAVVGLRLGLGLTLTVTLTLKQHSLEKK